MERRIFTRDEVTIIMGHDAKTVRKWIREMELPTIKNPQDGRERLISRESLDALCRVYGLIPVFTGIAPTDPGEYREVLIRPVDQSPRATGKYREVPTDTGIPAQLAQLQQRIAQLETENRRLRQPTAPQPPITSVPLAKTAPMRVPAGPRRKGDHGVPLDIPAGTVPYTQWAERHGISSSTAYDAARPLISRATGLPSRPTQVHAIKGEFHYADGHPIGYVLDVPGQAEAYRFFRNFKSFTPCPACPHTTAGPVALE